MVDNIMTAVSSMVIMTVMVIMADDIMLVMVDIIVAIMVNNYSGHHG